MPLFSIPLSGLNASSEALSVIANNLANLNTVGFKNSQATFRDLFYQNAGTNGAGNPMQIGAGVSVAGITTDFTTGSLDATGVSTDVAISGDGFFITDDQGARNYTRAGNFTVTAAGKLVTQDGQSVLGYGATNGVLSTNQVLGEIFLDKGQISPPHATANVQLHTNLDSAAAIGNTFSSPMTVHDSLGQGHVVTFTFTKTAANTWNYSLSLPAADTGGSGAPTVLRSGNLVFNGSGSLTSPTADVSGITISGFANGASNLSFTWQLLDPNTSVPMMSQVASASSTASTYQDGYASGTLVSFTINGDGVIEGAFTNGKSMAVGQLALANFANSDGLLRTGSNKFSSTLASGAAVTGTPGTGGRGTLTGGALELSNVDIAQEFSKMIVAQRGFQANAKVVTTFDEVTQDTINLKR